VTSFRGRSRDVEAAAFPPLIPMSDWLIANAPDFDW